MDPDQSTDASLTWFLGNMFLDRYYVIHDWEHGIKADNIMPRIGVYDKWDPNNKPWRPVDDDPVDPVDPINPPAPEEGGGAGTFWTIFLILFFLGLAAVLIKLYGRKCLEKIETMRNGGGTFQTGEYGIPGSDDPMMSY